MIIDSSAILAVLFEEDDGEALAGRIVTAPIRLMSAASYLEAGIVADNRPSAKAGPLLDRLMDELLIDVAPVTETQARIAREAYRTYGKGRHPAGLNFGDCLSYALAKATGEPLLYKGDDFTATDVAPA